MPDQRLCFDLIAWVIDHRPNAVERAFALARSGTVGGVCELLQRLEVDCHGSAAVILSRPAVLRQLRQVITRSRASPAGKTMFEFRPLEPSGRCRGKRAIETVSIFNN